MYLREIRVNWGESDPFGLVYYPRMLSWFNDTEHELFRTLGHPVDKMIRENRTAFVMGEIHFRFVGPAAYGDRVTLKLVLIDIGERTLQWHFSARITLTGAPVAEGTGTRVYAQIQDDGTLKSMPIPGDIRHALTSDVESLSTTKPRRRGADGETASGFDDATSAPQLRSATRGARRIESEGDGEV